MSRTYYVYILASKSRRLYIGVTNDLPRRMWEHKIDRLVYFEDTTDVRSAIEREKQLKGWRREKKISLIETINAAWEDLSARLQIIDAIA